jgi:predicted metal-binding protein
VSSSPKVVVRVCTNCRVEGDSAEPRAGARLYAALCAARGEADPLVAPVECFSVCKRPCTISFSARGAWTYVYGDFSAEGDPQDILAAARLYGEAPEGLIPWKQRPQALKKGVIARLPPFATEPQT